jgi:RND family efflux transporter MFP subunit
MSSTSQEEFAGRVAPRSLRDELASLKIDRKEDRRAVKASPPPRREDRPKLVRKQGPGFFLRLLTLVLWMVPLGVIGGGAYVAYVQYKKTKAQIEVKTTTVDLISPVEAKKILSAKGYLKSRYQAMIGARTPGRVEKMLVEEGTKVEKGQLLAVLEHNDMDATLESRKASINRVEADVAAAQADLKEKERKARLQASLYNRKQASANDVDEANAAREVSAAQVKSLEANVKFMKATTREIEATIRNMSIFAPFDGTIVEKGAEEGETITPGGMGAASGRGSVVTLADLGHLEVEADITETLVSKVAIGQPALIEVDAVPNKRFRGKLRQIIPMGDRARATVKVKVEILDSDPKLFPEIVAKAHFLPHGALDDPSAFQPALYVAHKAIVEDGDRRYAWVVDGSGRVSRRLIEVAGTDGDMVRVEKGLQAGDKVISSPPASLQDGEMVKVAD